MPPYIGKHRPFTVERVCVNGHQLPPGVSWCKRCEVEVQVVRVDSLATSPSAPALFG